MAFNAGTLFFDVEVNKQKFNQEVGELERGGSKLGGAIAGAVSIAAIAKLGQELFKLGSDAAEVGSKFNTVFSPNIQEANKVLDDLNMNYGLSRIEAQKLLSSTGDLLRGFGFSADAALDYSSNVNKLAADLASFQNVPVAQASEAITKALLGETESMKTLGVSVQQGTKEFKAQVAEIQTATGATLQQAKAQAIYQQILEQTTVAQGDFARTQDSTANKLKTLQARFTDLATDVATQLDPAFNDGLSTLQTTIEKAFKALQPFVPYLQNVIGFLGDIVEFIGNMIERLGPVFEVLASILTVLVDIGRWLLDIVDSTIEWAVQNSVVAVAMEKVNEKLAEMQAIINENAQATQDQINATTDLEQREAAILAGKAKQKEIEQAIADNMAKQLTYQQALEEAYKERSDSEKAIFNDTQKSISLVERFNNLFKEGKTERQILEEQLQAARDGLKQLIEAYPDVGTTDNFYNALVAQIEDLENRISGLGNTIEFDFTSQLQNGIVSAIDAFGLLGEAIVTGEDAWEVFKNAGINAIADVIDAIGTEIAIQGASRILTGDIVGGGGLLALAATAKLAAGALRGLAGGTGGAPTPAVNAAPPTAAAPSPNLEQETFDRAANTTAVFRVDGDEFYGVIQKGVDNKQVVT